MPDKNAPVVVKLSSPIMVAGEQTDELTVQPPKVKHLEALNDLRLSLNAESGTVELANFPKSITKAVEVLCGLTPKEVAEIDIRDLGKLGQAVWGFFAKSLPGLGASRSGQ